MEKDFKQGDIIEYCDEFFEVVDNYGDSGSVWILTGTYERTGQMITNFYWSAYGEDCRLVKSK